MFALIGWIIVGLIAGFIAKAIHKGDEGLPLWATIAVGIGGAILGGLVARIWDQDIFENEGFSIWKVIYGVGGAFVLLLIIDGLASRRRAVH